uniref:Link domain-containing protein n=1 Tax=Pyxicephalus adspersus TaxID=30357 RepID=A0AAV3AYA5_PYXAD|nr:TPA: hypothetical protein GDO54_007731 [Pyxicephalus adspersus]
MQTEILVCFLLFATCQCLPFYNGFYYDHILNNSSSNGNGDVVHFNGVKLVVDTPEDALFGYRGGNITLPCSFHYEPKLQSPRRFRVVFPYQPHHGRYQLNFHDAKKACEAQDAMMASFEQLFRAWEEGLDWCNAGWLMDGTVQYPITLPREPCGGKDTAPGVRNYGERHKHLHRYDVFCFSSALKGKVYYLEHPDKLTYAEAKEACEQDDAKIAKVGQLFAAWKFLDFDRCDAGWLDDGSVRYPIAFPRLNCGPPEPGVRSFGFPEKHKQFGVFCYKMN